MRAINEEMSAAVAAHNNFKLSNTEVIASEDGNVFVYLHGNKIYMEVNGKASFTLAGWNTPTTRSRLNALGVDIKQRNFAALHNGKEIDVNKWYNV